MCGVSEVGKEVVVVAGIVSLVHSIILLRSFGIVILSSGSGLKMSDRMLLNSSVKGRIVLRKSRHWVNLR